MKANGRWFSAGIGWGICSAGLSFGAATNGPQTNGVSLVVGPHLRIVNAVPEALPAAVDYQVVSPAGAVSNVAATASFVPPALAPIRLVKGGAVASLGLLRVGFSADVNSDGGAIRVLLPHGGEWRAQPRFIAASDGSRSVMLAELTNRVGGILGNSVIWTNCFSGLKASVRFTVAARGQGVHADVILHEAPPDPSAAPYNLGPNAQLELWTELFGLPPLRKEVQQIDLRAEGDGPVAGREDAVDETLDLGSARIVAGQSFLLDEEGTTTRRLPVAKRLVTTPDQRTFLIETLDWSALKSRVGRLPRQASVRDANANGTEWVDLQVTLPPRRSVGEDNPTLYASVSPPENGLVWDWVMMAGIAAPADIVSWYPAAGDANDVINGNNGTLRGGTGYTPGKVGRAFDFNGTDAYVEVPSSASLKPAGAFTIEAWVRFDSIWNNFASGIVTKGLDQETAMDWCLAIMNPGQLQPLAYIGGNWWYFDCATTMSSGTWYHVAMTYDGSSLSGYVNGALDGSTAVSGDVQTSDDPLRIGAYAPLYGTDSKCFFDGQIDEVALYNRALSAAEIQAIYDAGAAGKYVPISIAPPSDLVGWWPGDNHAQDLARGYHGTWYGTEAYANGNAPAGFISENFLAKAFQTTAGDFWYGGSFVEIPDRPELNLTEAVTLEAWVFPGSSWWGHRIIMGKDAEYGVRQYMMAISADNHLRVHVWAPNGAITWFDGPATIPLNTWTHVALTYDRNYLKSYVNGVLDGQLAATHPIRAGGQPLRIGASAPYPQGAPYSFSGIIDEATIYNRALSAAEVSAIYAAGGAGKSKTDTDGDGISDLWMTNHFGHPTGQVEDHSMAGDDADGDGISNLIEFQLGYNPTVGFVLPELKVVHGNYERHDGEYGTAFELGDCYTLVDYAWNWDEKDGGYAECVVRDGEPGWEYSSGTRFWLWADANGKFDPNGGWGWEEKWEDTPVNVVFAGVASSVDLFDWPGWRWNFAECGHLQYTDDRYVETTGSWSERDFLATDVKMVFRTNGKQGSTEKKLYAFSATVNPGYPPWETPPTIPNNQIVVRYFEVPLNPNGHVYGALADNQEYDVTVDCPAAYYAFDVGQVECPVEIVHDVLQPIEMPLDDWKATATSLRSPKYVFGKENNIYHKIAGPGGEGNNFWQVKVTSESDGTGVELVLDETWPYGLARYVNTVTRGEQLRLDDHSQELAYDTIKVVDEELLTFRLFYRLQPGGQLVDTGYETKVMVDRGEYAACGISRFFGGVLGDGAQLRQEFGYPRVNFWEVGFQEFPDNIGSSGAGNGMEVFIKAAGANNAAHAEADILYFSSHGAANGRLYDNQPSSQMIFSPNNGANGFNNGSDWNGDVDWGWGGACSWLDNLRGSDQGGGMTAWQCALFGSPRPAHGLLGYCEPSPGFQFDIEDDFFDHAAGSAESIVNAFINANAGYLSGYYPYAILCHSANQWDFLQTVSADTPSPLMKYWWYESSSDTGSLEYAVRSEQSGQGALFDPPADSETPIMFTRLLESPSLASTDGFKKTEFESGRVIFQTPGYKPDRGTQEFGRAESIAQGFIASRLGGIPKDAQLRSTGLMKEAEFDWSRRSTTWTEKTNGCTLEYEHKVEGVQVEGDHLAVIVASDRVAQVKWRWRTTERRQGTRPVVVRTAEQAMQLAMRGTSPQILERDVLSVRKKYYALGSSKDAEEMRLSWKIVLRDRRPMYVSAETGAIIPSDADINKGKTKRANVDIGNSQ